MEALKDGDAIPVKDVGVEEYVLDDAGLFKDKRVSGENVPHVSEDCGPVVVGLRGPNIVLELLEENYPIFPEMVQVTQHVSPALKRVDEGRSVFVLIQSMSAEFLPSIIQNFCVQCVTSEPVCFILRPILFTGSSAYKLGHGAPELINQAQDMLAYLYSSHGTIIQAPFPSHSTIGREEVSNVAEGKQGSSQISIDEAKLRARMMAKSLVLSLLRTVQELQLTKGDKTRPNIILCNDMDDKELSSMCSEILANSIETSPLLVSVEVIGLQDTHKINFKNGLLHMLIMNTVFTSPLQQKLEPQKSSPYLSITKSIGDNALLCTSYVINELKYLAKSKNTSPQDKSNTNLLADGTLTSGISTCLRSILHESTAFIYLIGVGFKNQDDSTCYFGGVDETNGYSHEALKCICSMPYFRANDLNPMHLPATSQYHILFNYYQCQREAEKKRIDGIFTARKSAKYKCKIYGISTGVSKGVKLNLSEKRRQLAEFNSRLEYLNRLMEDPTPSELDGRPPFRDDKDISLIARNDIVKAENIHSAWAKQNEVRDVVRLYLDTERREHPLTMENMDYALNEIRKQQLQVLREHEKRIEGRISLRKEVLSSLYQTAKSEDKDGEENSVQRLDDSVAVISYSTSTLEDGSEDTEFSIIQQSEIILENGVETKKGFPVWIPMLVVSLCGLLVLALMLVLLLYPRYEMLESAYECEVFASDGGLLREISQNEVVASRPTPSLYNTQLGEDCYAETTLWDYKTGHKQDTLTANDYVAQTFVYCGDRFQRKEDILVTYDESVVELPSHKSMISVGETLVLNNADADLLTITPMGQPDAPTYTITKYGSTLKITFNVTDLFLIRYGAGDKTDEMLVNVFSKE